jgi:hypothetical protein
MRLEIYSLMKSILKFLLLKASFALMKILISSMTIILSTTDAINLENQRWDLTGKHISVQAVENQAICSQMLQRKWEQHALTSLGKNNLFLCKTCKLE